MNNLPVKLTIALTLLAAFLASPTSSRAEGTALTARAFLPLATATRACTFNAEESAILAAMQNDARQGRVQLVCSVELMKAARSHALDMGIRNYFGHVTPAPNSVGPNQMARNAGYVLPAWYDTSITANNIESIAAGYATPDSVWAAWMNSDPHRQHLLGLNGFYAEQIEIGIGYAYVPTSTYKYQWVVMTAKRGP